MVTEGRLGKIGRISLDGSIAEVPLPNPQAVPELITAGPDGALWFTEWGGNKIGRITTAGLITEYTIPTADAQPQGITAGPDGALWFAEVSGGKIGRITTAGEMTEYTMPTAHAGPRSIVTGPDGALWFTEFNAVKIGRITTAGEVTEYPLTGTGKPWAMTVGPDGALWFAAEYSINRIELPKSRAGVLCHIAAGGTWTTVISLINTHSVPMPVTVKLYNNDGGALALPLTVTEAGGEQMVSASSVDATIDPNATLLISMGEPLAPLNQGWAEVLSPGTPSGFAIFRETPSSGPASEGTVYLQTQFPATVVLPFDNAEGFFMGVGMANLANAPATITGTIYDESGRLLGSASIPLAGNGHTSFLLPDQFPLTVGQRGIVRFQSSWTAGLTALGLRFSPANTFTSVPMMQ